MLAIIGGTGLYQLDNLKILSRQLVKTPFGDTSAEITTAEYADRKVLFLPRHGDRHQLLPSEVNYRANIWALKKLGASQIIGVSAVGSLQHEIAPGDLSIPDQYFDFVKGHREKSFFGNGLVAHVSTAEPICHDLAKGIVEAANKVDIPIHQGKTYAAVDGPRLGTRAESLFLKEVARCDLVGMTNVPEVFLAREAQLSYCTLTIATDYDCWKDDPDQHVSVEQVINRYGASLEKAKTVLLSYLSQSPAICNDGCQKSLSTSILTPLEQLTEAQHELLKVLQQ